MPLIMMNTYVVGDNTDVVDDQIDVNHAHGAYCNDTIDININ